MTSTRPRPPYLLDDSPDGPVVALRLHTVDDADRVVEQCRDPQSVAQTAVPAPYSREDAITFCTQVIPGGWEDGTEWGFAVDVDGRFGGTVTLRPERSGRAEVAYGAHPDVRGTGVMERALRLLLEWGFDEQGLETVVWYANRGNFPSRRLAWKVGVRVEGTLRRYLRQREETYDAWVGTLLAGDPREPATPWLEVPRVESPRLPIRLRAFRESDVPRIVEACTDLDTSGWLSGVVADYDEAAAYDDILRAREGAAAGTSLPMAVAATDDDRLLARVSIFDLSTVRRCGELGYWVHPAERGTGVATEAVRLLLRHALVPEEDGGLGLERVTAHAAVANTASRRVLEKAGMRELCVESRATRTRDGLADAALYELTV
ncbi:hypothetical protein GCM10011519_13180 [Marmoricola endophyticus]|uniref:N-acetyltransferase domain-containing protein n=1 Tax=Marmoricola endophyticus TaxID=2040280 RepID=A0A917BH61_9ACTN|nr:GNAT family N-acetyltransferase [Marmoricola endophyticus]GGF40864.1 hypothetical protein GCM10011519_13180 [Marmoricola endophyticus]